MFNSCTSALMQLILQYGVHLGDAGGFGPREEVGYFLARSEYGKAKRKRTALLGAAHAEGYIAALQCTLVQQAYVKILLVMSHGLHSSQSVAANSIEFVRHHLRLTF